MNKPLVLLCEDSEDTIFITTFLLESEGFHVEVARDTEEISEKINLRKPQVILMDLQLPHIGGESAIRKLREENNTKDIPVVLLSAGENLKDIAGRINADGYIHKPFDTEELINVINSKINKSIENNWST